MNKYALRFMILILIAMAMYIGYRLAIELYEYEISSMYNPTEEYINAHVKEQIGWHNSSWSQ